MILEKLLEHAGIARRNDDMLKLVEVLNKNLLYRQVRELQMEPVTEGEHAQVIQAERKEWFLKELPHIELAAQHSHLHRQSPVKHQRLDQFAGVLVAAAETPQPVDIRAQVVVNGLGRDTPPVDQQSVEIEVADRRVVQGFLGIGQQPVPVVMNAQIIAHPVLEQIRPAVVRENLVQITIRLPLRKAHHLQGVILQRDDLADIEAAGQVVHRHRQHTGHEHPSHRTLAYPCFDHLEECPEERIPRGQLLVEPVLVRRQELVGEIIVFVDDDIHRRRAGSGNGTQDRRQGVTGRLRRGYRREICKRLVFRRETAHRVMGNRVERTLDMRNIRLDLDLREIKAHHQMAVAGGGWIAPDIGFAEKLLEAVLAVDVVVAFENRAPEAFAKTARTQEDRDLVLLDLTDKPGLIHEVIVVADNFLVISHCVWNAPFHAQHYAGG